MLADETFSNALQVIRSQIGDRKPSVLLILGSGLGALADQIAEPIPIPYGEIPGFPLSHVAGHAGKLVVGRIGKTEVAALAGRSHLYEGWSPQESTFPLRVLSLLGAKTLFVSNASGGINPRYKSGQVVLIDNHIDWMQRSPFQSAEVKEQPGCWGMHHRGHSPYDEKLMARAQATAIQLGFTLERGTYLATLGPTYETRSEYRMFAKMGADMVGMSTVPEVLVANLIGLRVLAFSIITNVAKPDAPTKTEHAEVLDWSRHAQSKLIPLIQTLLAGPLD